MMDSIITPNNNWHTFIYIYIYFKKELNDFTWQKGIARSLPHEQGIELFVIMDTCYDGNLKVN